MKTSRRDLFLFSQVLILIILLSACKPTQTILTTEEAPEETVFSGYPGPDAIPDQQENIEDFGYPAFEQKPTIEYYPDSIVIPSPKPNTGVVTGRLLLLDTQEPFLAPALYLGEVINNANSGPNLPQVLSVTTGVDPVAVQSQNGIFVFSDINPGEYGIIIWTPMSLLPIRDVNSTENNIIIVKVDAGETTDLGDIFVE